MSLTTQIVINMMKKLLLALMLISPASFADWGDVYYCQMTSHSMTNPDGKITEYMLEKFQFKLDKAKEAMVFGKAGYLSGFVLKLREDSRFLRQESWDAYTRYSLISFYKGKFRLALVNSEITSVAADCDKF